MDGVVFDLMSVFVDKYNEKYNDTKTIKHVNQYHFYHDWGLNHDQCFSIFNDINQTETKLIDSNIPKYLKIINSLPGIDIDIVTLKPKKKRPNVVNALNQNGIKKGVHYNKLIIKSYEIPYIKASLNYDLYIDDSTPLIEHLIENYPEKKALVFNQPWNKDFHHVNVVRIYEWWQIYHYLTGILPWDGEKVS